MAEVADLRKIMVALHAIGHAMTDDEVCEIARIIYLAADRLEKE